MEGFKLKESGGRVQNHNARSITSSCEISQVNQKTNHLKGVYDCGRSSYTPLGKPACLITSLKCLYTNTHNMGNNQEKLEVCVQSQDHDLIAITETWWDSSHDWNDVVDGYVLFMKDRPAIQGGGVALCVSQQLECIELCG